jgi:hypothetical protein
LGIPLGYLGVKNFGLKGFIVGWVVGAMISGLPTDKFLERRFGILKVRFPSPPG